MVISPKPARPEQGPSVRRESGDGVELDANEFQVLRRHHEMTWALIRKYAAAALEAEQSGRTVNFVIKVAPNATAEVQAEDELDIAMAAAQARGQARVADILQGEEMLTARAFGEEVSMSHETVNQKRKTGEILGLEGAKRGVRYPRWQVAPGHRPLPGLPEVFEALGRDPWRVFGFLRTPRAEFGGATALDLLKADRIGDVRTALQNVEQGAFA